MTIASVVRGVTIARAPDASCGDCTMCCKLMAVSALDKPSCVWCEHAHVGRGCGIYEQRPQSCRDFECVWLQSQKSRHGEAALLAEMRPDRSRVVIDVRTNGKGLVFHVDPDRPKAHEHGATGRLFDSLLRAGQEVIVVVGNKRTLCRGGHRGPG